jgi:hypothetical protein
MIKGILLFNSAAISRLETAGGKGINGHLVLKICPPQYFPILCREFRHGNTFGSKLHAAIQQD